VVAPAAGAVATAATALPPSAAPLSLSPPPPEAEIGVLTFDADTTFAVRWSGEAVEPGTNTETRTRTRSERAREQSNQKRQRYSVPSFKEATEPDKQDSNPKVRLSQKGSQITREFSLYREQSDAASGMMREGELRT
jgi:hypothetical protein